jgi:ABC-type glycerol-3-phosphate transport system substrate-binding protein
MNICELLNPNVLSVIILNDCVLDLSSCFSAITEVGGSFHLLDGLYVSNGIIGINKASESTELAKEFVQYVFSQESQLVHVRDGLPMNTLALDSWISREYYPSYMSIVGPDYDYSVLVSSLTSKQQQEISTMIEQLKTPMNNGAYVMYLINSEAKPYFSGELDLDTTCDNIINKVNLYINEQY